nr:hypothetical protein [uncultured Oscillibacter sp.]
MEKPRIGYFGVSGCSLCCVANYDEARVELVFAKADKAANKQAQFHSNWIKRFYDVIVPYVSGMQFFNRL